MASLFDLPPEAFELSHPRVHAAGISVNPGTGKVSHGGQFAHKAEHAPEPDAEPEVMPIDDTEPEVPEPAEPLTLNAQVERMMSWTGGKVVNTARGPRMLKTARPSSQWWDLWRDHKDKLKALGLGSGKDDRGNWQVQWWLPVPGAQTSEQVKSSVEASRSADADVDVPAPPGHAYLPFQKAGIAYALKRKNVLFGDEMGLGKTMQAIGVCNATPDARRVLIVCPATPKLTWAEKFAEWDTKGLTVGVASGPKLPDTDVVILNYDVLKKYREQIGARQWDVLIADESHYVKNPKAQRTQMLLGGGDKKLPPIEAGRRMFLTGTPITNRVHELWTTVKALDPTGLGASWKGFHVRYCDAHQDRFGWKIDGAANLDELQDRLRASIMVRRLKKEVLPDLPGKFRQVVELETDPAIRRLLQSELSEYDAKSSDIERMRADAELAEASGDDEAYREAVGKLHDANQALFTEMARIRHEVAVAKLPAVIEHVKDALDGDPGKLIVFVHHKDLVDALMQEFGDTAVKIDGSMSAEARHGSAHAFQNDPSKRLFVGSIRACSEAITLTSASHVMFGELDWTPAKMMQAEDRAHRIGQSDNVFVEHLVLNGSLDARMAHALVAKMNTMDAALDDRHDGVRTYGEAGEVPVLPSVDLSAPITSKSDGKTHRAEHEPDMTPEQIDAARRALARLANDDPDMAQAKNDIGFNRFDGRIGHSLNAMGTWNQSQAKLARKVLRKYRNQLGLVAVAAMGVDVSAWAKSATAPAETVAKAVLVKFGTDSAGKRETVSAAGYTSGGATYGGPDVKVGKLSRLGSIDAAKSLNRDIQSAKPKVPKPPKSAAKAPAQSAAPARTAIHDAADALHIAHVNHAPKMGRGGAIKSHGHLLHHAKPLTAMQRMQAHLSGTHKVSGIQQTRIVMPNGRFRHQYSITAQPHAGGPHHVVTVMRPLQG
jgi:SWI/SNF-related matrix-associated actin-dependent regulator 1 of chromatin subfamily A